jgi:hypothetical protein
MQSRSRIETCIRRSSRACLDAPADLYPRQALANALAKRKAARYLKNIDEYF